MQGAGGPDIVAAVDGILEVASGNGRRYLSGREDVGLPGLPVFDVEDVPGDPLGRPALPLPRRPPNSEWVEIPPWLQSGPGRAPSASTSTPTSRPSRRTPPSTSRVWPDLDRRIMIDFFEGKAWPTCDDGPRGVRSAGARGCGPSP